MDKGRPDKEERRGRSGKDRKERKVRKTKRLSFTTKKATPIAFQLLFLEHSSHRRVQPQGRSTSQSYMRRLKVRSLLSSAPAGSRQPTTCGGTRSLCAMTHRSARGTKSDMPRLPLPLLLLLLVLLLCRSEPVWRTHAGKAIVIGDRSMKAPALDKGRRGRVLRAKRRRKR